MDRNISFLFLEGLASPVWLAASSIPLSSSRSSLGSASSASNLRDRARAHAATSAVSGASNASSISSFTPNQVLFSQSSIGQQSLSGRQGLVRIVTSVGGSSAKLGGTDCLLG